MTLTFVPSASNAGFEWNRSVFVQPRFADWAILWLPWATWLYSSNAGKSVLSEGCKILGSVRVVDSTSQDPILELQFGHHSVLWTLPWTSECHQIPGAFSFLNFILGLFEGDWHFSVRIASDSGRIINSQVSQSIGRDLSTDPPEYDQKC